MSAVKIGSTASSAGLKKRLTKLNEGNPRRLYVVALDDGTQKDEKHLHSMFHSERVRGEWFTRGPLVSAFILKNQMAPISVKDRWPDACASATQFKHERSRAPVLLAMEEQRRKEKRAQRVQALVAAKAEGKRVHCCSSCNKPGHYAGSLECEQTLPAMRPANDAYYAARTRALMEEAFGRKPRVWEWRGKQRVG